MTSTVHTPHGKVWGWVVRVVVWVVAGLAGGLVAGYATTRGQDRRA